MTTSTMPPLGPFYRRPFGSFAEMDRVLVNQWNAVVEPGDQVLHLGDLAVRQSAEYIAYEHLCQNRDQFSRVAPSNTVVRLT
jgi:hypothetical protein